MRIVLYGNGTCGNHGCEAIARGTISLLGADTNTYRIQSENPAEDKKYGLEEFAQISPAKSERKKDFRFVVAYAKLKLAKYYVDMDGLSYLHGSQESGSWADIALSVGGDNYCYGST
ncbi:MAG: polysaccharide pyruvyl transferase family protein, partial [Faecousia sp.]